MVQYAGAVLIGDCSATPCLFSWESARRGGLGGRGAPPVSQRHQQTGLTQRAKLNSDPWKLESDPRVLLPYKATSRPFFFFHFIFFLSCM